MKSRQTSSLRSVRSRSSREQKMDIRFYQAKLDFEKELCEACTWYDCHGVYVTKNQLNDDYYKTLKANQKKVMSKRMSMAAGTLLHAGTSAIKSELLKDDVAVAGHTGNSEVTTLNTYSSADEPQAGRHRVDSIYDAQGELVELLISKATNIPRVLLQCITLLSPHFRYLTKFSIVKSRLNGYALLELKNMLQLSHLTEIVLDKSVLLNGNYAVLLENTPKLRYLSLVSCGVSDEVSEEIASNLDATISPFSNLALLNLSSNQLSDSGVQRLAQALKTNRSLRYLNLANNQITDAGAMPLLDVCMEFPLTNNDIEAKQKRYLVYKKEKMIAYKRLLQECDSKSMIEEPIFKPPKSATPSISSKKSKKGSSISSAPVSARDDCEFKLFNDPLSPECLKLKDNFMFCIGNFVLCYLNLSYNNLTYLTLKKLETVMFYQSSTKKTADLGLMKVLIDGNPMPEHCTEYNTLSQLMVNSIFKQCQSHDGIVKRKSIMNRNPRK